MTPHELNSEIDRKYPFFDLPERIKRQKLNDHHSIRIYDLIVFIQAEEDKGFWMDLYKLEETDNLTLETVRAVYLKHGIPLPEEKEEFEFGQIKLNPPLSKFPEKFYGNPNYEKHDFYKKLLEKLEKLKSGELTLDEYIVEVQEKIKR